VGIVNYLIKQKNDRGNNKRTYSIDVILSGQRQIPRDDPERRYGRIDRRAEEINTYIIQTTGRFVSDVCSIL
jgi:hypothetical protein